MTADSSIYHVVVKDVSDIPEGAGRLAKLVLRRSDEIFSVHHASVGYHVRAETVGLTGTTKYWRPTYRGAMSKLHKLVGAHSLSMGSAQTHHE